MSDEEVESPYDAPKISDDFLTGDVAAGLEKMRLRLLDLTGRNRLLNFPQRPSKSILRFVDELPDQLFGRLIEGKELYFKPVPPPRGTARSSAATETQLSLASVDAQTVRGTSQKPAARDHAATLGISTDYDLPLGDPEADDTPRKHSDNNIQCLHYPDELEGILRNITSAARLAIEETGTNMLYLAFGFLEWYENAESTQARYAPLILLPVALSREDADAETRAYRFAVRYSGEDVLANICLQEKLRRDFKLELPSLADFETPDSYFRRIAPLLRIDERWKIRRHVTLTLLSFGKLLMYRDLDGRNWPMGRGPGDHGRITEFFRGIQRDHVTFAEDYKLDENPTKERVPPIVDEADSSQHSALVDAIAGKNLVIEGPPGTGKSQTITNLVAAAMAAGKTVLFVSEKLAALEVVRHRLDKVGLGWFCLELHSHKSQKRQLLDDIQNRLRLSRRFSAPSELQERLALLENDRARLTAYSNLVNTPFGAMDLTLNQVMWQARRRRRSLKFNAEIVDAIRIQGAENIDANDFANRRQRISQYVAHLETVWSHADALRTHSWFGTRNSKLSFLEQSELTGQLARFRDAARGVAHQVAELNVGVGAAWLPDNIVGIEAIRIAVDGLPNPAQRIIASLIPRLSNPQVRQRLLEFRAWVQRYWTIADSIRATVGVLPNVSESEITVLAESLDEARVIAPGCTLSGHLGEAGHVYAELSEKISKVQNAYDIGARWLGADIPFTPAGCYHMKLAFERVRSLPLDKVHYRHSGLTLDNATIALEAGFRESTSLKELRARLSKSFDLSLVPKADVLKRHLSTVTNARWWSFLEGEYRNAKRAYRGITLKSGSLDRDTMRRGFRELINYVEASERFARNAGYRSTGGPFFDDIDTPFGELLAIQTWLSDTRREFASLGADGSATCERLWQAPREWLMAMRDADGDAGNIRVPLASLENAVAATAKWDANVESPRADSRELRVLGAAMGAAGAQLTKSAGVVASIGLPPTTSLAGVPELVRQLTEIASLRTLVGSSREVESALGDSFKGLSTSLEDVARTERFYDCIVQSSVPSGLKSWLLTEDVVDRLTHVHHAAAALGTGIGGCRDLWERFEARASIEPREWFGGSNGIEQSRLDSMIQRAQHAISGESQLSSWLDYLRAREQLSADGLAPLVALAEANQIAPRQLIEAFHFVFANSLVHAAFKHHPDLAQFSGLSHNEIRKRFAQLDRESIELHRKQTAWKIDQRRVPMGLGSGPVSTWTELELIENEISKQKRHIPLRQLMLRAGRALQALKPCFMMGPLSVAQYLPPDTLKFDLVVMDEASQLKPEDALGAVARGSQVVIVGDRMQLPPTSFFDRVGEDDEEEGADESAELVADAESILDVATTVYKPVRLLRWHYRSRHGSLIAFSNKEFYKSELVAFPSPDAKSPTYGVKLIPVRDGVYEDRRNVVEAKRVVESALRHMHQRPNETLGIVTLNAPQRELIESIVDERLKSDPIAQDYIKTSMAGLEPFFIKNLENVQGDERDVIFISVTYGRSANGHLYQRFGPINGPTGHRRLNVLFTRARNRVVLFTSMAAEDIQLQSRSSRGAKALKGYLQYAQTGVLENALLSGREPDSDFEIEVAEALRAKGYDVVAQVGVAGYYMDLAIKHPRKADAFILGIECDGATYHSSHSARDRDRLRQNVLEALGWTIHRIWSTDWFKQPDHEAGRIVDRIDALIRDEIARQDFENADLVDVDESTAIGNAKPAMQTAWLGEAAEQPLSVDEARGTLLQLRDEISVAKGRPVASDALLRDAMLEIFLRHKPATKDDWKRHTPLDLRLETSGEEVQEYLDRVIEVTRRMAR
jgi:very-short-patch-repair endonuclease